MLHGRFHFYVPRIQITDPVSGKSYTKVVLPDFLLPRQQHCAKNILLFLACGSKKSKEESKEHDSALMEVMSVTEWDDYNNVRSSSRGSRMGAYIRRHRRRYLQLLNQKKIFYSFYPVSPPCDPYRLPPTFAKKRQAKQLYFLDSSGLILNLRLTGDGLPIPRKKLIPHNLTWPAPGQPDNVPVVWKSSHGSCHTYGDSS